jgi:hypothetical protein
MQYSNRNGRRGNEKGGFAIVFFLEEPEMRAARGFILLQLAGVMVHWFVPLGPFVSLSIRLLLPQLRCCCQTNKKVEHTANCHCAAAH